MQRYLGVAIAALLVLGGCTSSFAKGHPDLCSDAKVQQVKDAVAKGADLQAAATQAGSDPQCLTADEQTQAQASFAAFQAQQSPTPTPTPTAAATTAAPTSAAATPTASAAPSPTDTPAATTAAPTQAPTTQAPTAPPKTPAPTVAPTPVPTPAPTSGGVPGGVPNATGPVPPGFTRYGGTVLDSSTGAPIKGVCVYSGPPAGCPQQGTPRTDATGWFAIDYPAGASFLWTFEHPSYQALISQPIAGGTNPTFRLVHR